MNLAERAATRNNNFDVLRLLAAMLVLVSHSFVLTGRSEPGIGQQAFGELGVSAFFAISGFLIARSWDLDPDAWRFFVKRALRLLPALIVVVVLTAFVMGAAETTLPLMQYLKSGEVYRYVAQSSVLYTFAGGHLPGVFAHNVYPTTVNGSLWTLPIEALAYVGAAILGLLGALRRRPALPIVSLVILAVLTSPIVDTRGISAPGPLGPIFPEVVYLWALFNLGLLAYTMRARITLRWDLCAVLLIVWLAASQTDWARLGAVLFIPYCVLVLAYRTPSTLAAIARPGDVSYGVYIYAFPAQQTAGYLWGPHLGPMGMLGLVIVPVYLLALASWRVIESPALGLKRRIGRKTQSRPRPELSPVLIDDLSSADEA